MQNGGSKVGRGSNESVFLYPNILEWWTYPQG